MKEKKVKMKVTDFECSLLINGSTNVEQCATEKKANLFDTVTASNLSFFAF